MSTELEQIVYVGNQVAVKGGWGELLGSASRGRQILTYQLHRTFPEPFAVTTQSQQLMALNGGQHYLESNNAKKHKSNANTCFEDDPCNGPVYGA